MTSSLPQKLALLKKKKPAASSRAPLLLDKHYTRKEKLYTALSKILTEQGLTVRREELKRGPGWKAMSGVCRAVTDNIVLIDRKLPLNDQIAFLIGVSKDSAIVLSDDITSEIASLFPSAFSPTLPSA
jgi:hypothetical protein